MPFFAPLFFSPALDTDVGAAIRLEGCELEGGEVEIAVTLDSSRGVCGIMLELFYDEEAFLLLSVGAEKCGLELSYRDFGGVVRVLFDGVENSADKCELVRFYFKRKNGRGGVSEFVLGAAVEAFCIYDGALTEVNASVELGRFCVGEDGQREGGEVVLASLSARVCEDGEVELGFCLKSMGEAFALGAEIFLIDYGGEGKCSEFLVSSVVAPSGEGEMWIRIGEMQSFCAVITPVGYEGRGTVEGEKCVAVVNVHGGEVFVEVS